MNGPEARAPTLARRGRHQFDGPVAMKWSAIAPVVANQVASSAFVRCSKARRSACDPEWLAHDEGVQRNAVDQRLSPRLALHLVEICDDHVGKSLGGAVMKGDHRNVVHLLRVRHERMRPLRVRIQTGWSSIGQSRM